MLKRVLVAVRKTPARTREGVRANFGTKNGTSGIGGKKKCALLIVDTLQSFVPSANYSGNFGYRVLELANCHPANSAHLEDCATPQCAIEND